ncbi:hypothetical protein [Amycolatopsis circi]|uniref:hypothetical protein n=1 Tax=Amycolatopsis circi TaxID=871959 RepID=UPI000E27F2AB|nr:hypothetical protein [Amycolatopsis circi]
MTETTIKTPAAELAEKLTAVAEHLRRNPHLPSVNVDARSAKDPSGFVMQIAAYGYLGEVDGVQALLAWAKSFDHPTISLRWHDEEARTVTVEVEATLGGYTARVWDTEGGDLHRWRTGGKYARTEITLARLTEYVAAGTVEGLGA